MDWRAHPFWTTAALAAATLVAVTLLWDWNWLRPLVEWQASAALGREVRMSHFDMTLLSRTPRLTADDLTVANPEGFPADSEMGSAKRLSFRIDALALLGGRLNFPEVTIDRPRGALRDNAEGKRNWDFGGGAEDSKDETPLDIPEIGSLVIRDGRIHIADRKLKSDVTALIHTDETKKGGEPTVAVDATGTYNAQAFELHFRGGSLLSLREKSKPYPVDLRATNGGTRIALKGTVLDPVTLAGARLKLDLEGKNLADLYPLTGIPLAPTPPYKLKGALDYAGGKIRFHDFAGTVGKSDLSGKFEVDPGKDRPRITATLTSRRVVMADLGGFIGATPGTEDTPNQSAEQQAEHARDAADAKLLPDDPINLPEIRAADFDVRYEGRRIEGENMPLDNLKAHLLIENGKVALDPLSFGVGTGEIFSHVALDARENVVHAKADVDFRKVDLKRIMKSTDIFEGAGTIGGRAFIDAKGNSLSAMLGSGDGDLKLFMTGGDLSALLVNLAGLDLGRSILSAIGLPQRADIRCMVSDFALRNGQLQTRALLFDTTEANITGKGVINFWNEQIAYQIQTEPKHFSVGSVAAPIKIKGPLKDPAIYPDPGELAARTGSAAALGILLTPLAALIPTIELGLGEDNDCVASVKTVEAAGKALPKIGAGEKKTRNE
ncbi:MAG: AsmA family protein [Parvibaculum sp.]|uniref:AsmA family protein n=1 Tax=Parvibaculum sp. TaxID=2024848 RepID=UPI0025F6A75E|nr:AsmA family protein [Parvibaculum sp.]MCE9651184.1 AsmA family protein [Parvibaculum sp.]